MRRVDNDFWQLQSYSEARPHRFSDPRSSHIDVIDNSADGMMSQSLHDKALQPFMFAKATGLNTGMYRFKEGKAGDSKASGSTTALVATPSQIHLKDDYRALRVTPQ